MKKNIYLFIVLLCFGSIFSTTAQTIYKKSAKIHHNRADIVTKKGFEQDEVTRKQSMKAKQNLQKSDKKAQPIDFETMKKLKRDDAERKRSSVSSNTIRKSSRNFSSPQMATYGKKADANKYSEAEIAVMKQQKEAQQTQSIKLERKAMSASSKKLIQTSYTKESLRKDIAKLEQKVFCAEEKEKRKADDIQKIKQAISNKAKLLKTLK